MATVSLLSTTLPSSSIHRHRMTWVRTYSYISSLAALAILAVGWKIYRRLNHSDRLPFDSWKVTLGFARRNQFTCDEATQVSSAAFDGVMNKYSLTDLISRLYAYTLSTAENAPEKLENSAQWLQWLRSPQVNNEKELRSYSSEILPSTNEESPLSIEDTQELKLYSYVKHFQFWAPLIRGIKEPWNDVLSLSLLAPPSSGMTLLFYLTSHITITECWALLKDGVPIINDIQNKFYPRYKAYICAILLTASIAFYHLMNQGKRLFKNLTENWEAFHKVHQGFDHIAEYQSKLDILFQTIAKTSSGANRSSIVWYSNQSNQQTFKGELGKVLAEMSASGRVFNEHRTSLNYPGLKNLKVLQLNLNDFLVFQDKQTMLTAWNETLRQIAAMGNVIVVVEGYSAIRTCIALTQGSERNGSISETASESQKTLFSLVSQSLREGKMRFILQLDESEKKQLCEHPDFAPFFECIEAPKMSSSGLELLTKRLYCEPFNSYSLPKIVIERLFRVLKSPLESGALDVSNTLDFFQKMMDSRKHQAQLQRNPLENLEKKMGELQQIKNQLLRKFWKQKRAGQDPSPSLSKALILIQRVLIPLYQQQITQVPLNLDQLLMNLQSYFNRLIGPAQKEEEDRLKAIATNLKEKIKGQNQAIEEIGRLILEWRTSPPRDKKPLVLMFAGPSGSGKTETGTQVAYELFKAYGIETDTSISNLKEKIIRISLNQGREGFQWEFVKNSILNFLKSYPTGVVIFEEWDKMPAEQKNNLLELLEGTPIGNQMPFWIGNQKSSIVDLSCATFIITCNIAAKALKDPTNQTVPIQEQKEQFLKDRETVKASIREIMPHEQAEAMISRLNASIIPYRGISKEAAEQLIDLCLEEAVQSTSLKDPEDKGPVKALVLNVEKLPTDGRLIQDLVKDKIAEFKRSKAS